MSQKSKVKFGNFFRPSPAAAPVATDVAPGERAQVTQLIANGKAGVAVDLARTIHKRLGIPASEALLLDAYEARIRSLAERNLDAEANTLLLQVRERFPSSRDRLSDAAAMLKARAGDIEALLELLADTGLTPERRATIEERIRHTAADPARIARCQALPAEHPLRVAAAAVAAALEAVTSGPVTPDRLALPEISRQSPLAPWKMALRAIAAFYAHQDELCEKCLEAVEPGTPAARLGAPLRAMLARDQKLSPAGEAVAAQAGGGAVALRATLAALDRALDKSNHGLALQEIARAVPLCRESFPELADRLKQHISIRGLLAGIKAERTAAAMGGPSLKNAYFWRLLARAHEEMPGAQSIPMAASLWEEFRRHAVHEKWFPPNGTEIAALYVHMSDLWKRIENEEQEFVARKFAAHFPGNREYYAGQPAQIRALMPPPSLGNLYYLEPEALYQRACQADPCAENFQRWLAWERQQEHDASDRVAEMWAAALPDDIPPVLHLMQSAESTNALKRAFTLMERAERLDALNPEVRRARLRLLVSLAKRHLQKKKTHLAEPELRQLEELPQARQGDRPALVAALRWVFWTIGGKLARADEARAEVVRVLGSDLAAEIVLRAVASACKLKTKLAGAFSGGPLAAALARACALGEDTGLKIEIPGELSDPLMSELSAEKGVPDAVALAALGETALRMDDFPLAYAVSTAGLKLSRERWAEFLFLRARCLFLVSQSRLTLCADAASELARRQRNLDLLARIGKWREQEETWRGRSQTDVAMSTQQIDDLLRQEKEWPDFDDGPGDDGDGDFCDCPACRAERNGEMPPEMEEMLDEFGPEVLERALEEIIGGLGRPKRRKRRAHPAFGTDDVPF